ncbi:NEDD8-specific protease 1 [Camellia lanceoleosa]|uniref:NEDD8-specific protease 1 n=1 Tax=Camellia lanceoleosa TaxID=1840588 RepID=A0ACC0F732_9ERIC|nr:NEDD8-specific protease 1 [Camellia lanceoleosa]
MYSCVMIATEDLMLGMPNSFTELLLDIWGSRYVECSKTPQQVNGYNCGLYGAAIAKAICSWYESKSEPNDDDGLWFSTMNEQVNPSVVEEMRTVILGLVKSSMAMNRKS